MSENKNRSPGKKSSNGPMVTFADIAGCADAGERDRLLDSFIRRMTLDEKIAQMSGSSNIIDLAITAIRYGFITFDSGGNRRLGIPAIKFTDGPRGICLGKSTCFPVAMARGATWDALLMELVGNALGKEARAQGANFFGGVCINLLRHPGWGRAQETFGEDPFALGVMGAATIKGVQEHVMTCAKHFACNSIEKSRFFVDVHIDERTLREVYLPHFKRCVEAGVASIMSAYNKVNGLYCGHNPHLLRDILKRDWGFEGLVMSDWILGVRDGVAAATGGLDIEMPSRWRYGRNFRKAIKRGDVPEHLIDDAVKRVIRQKARFADIGDASNYDSEQVAGPANTKLALEVAEKSLVLLKNEKNALPLDENRVKKIAVIGKLADKVNTGDHGSSRVRPPYVVTPLEGIRKRVGDSIDVVHIGSNDPDKARRVASQVDAAIVIAGLTCKEEGEYISSIAKKWGGDRANLDLPHDQETLIKAVGEAGNRSIIVLECGSAVTVRSWEKEADAIVLTWYSGMEGGNALAHVLFGDVNPSGKLPATFPESVEQLPFFDKKAESIEYGYYHGYRLFDKEDMKPSFPFGFGMSYTTYQYENLRLDKKEITDDGIIKAQFEVTNTGKVHGEEIAQLYIGYQNSKIDRPLKELKGFSRFALAPGEKKVVTIEVDIADLAYYDDSSGSWKIEEIDYAVLVGPSSRWEDLSLQDSFRFSRS
ncbi:MAG: glycoside hydrolase family 3 C-terminal domain-containing protein [Actinobacteria bacterium]|nr:glycoside hydrolase family 3 C-terminal domain-containing protein [Actinomycetota bacterium]